MSGGGECLHWRPCLSVSAHAKISWVASAIPTSAKRLPPGRKHVAMIAVESSAFMQSVFVSTSLDSALDSSDALKHELKLSPKQAQSPDSHEALIQLISSTEPDEEHQEQKGKPARQLTRRQLKHREAMVRFRQRKKAKIAVLEEQEQQLQQELKVKLREFQKRQALHPTTVDDLLGLTDPRVNLQRAIVGAILKIEAILDENEALEEAIAEHEKFHSTLKRVRERIIESSVWKCV